MEKAFQTTESRLYDVQQKVMMVLEREREKRIQNATQRRRDAHRRLYRGLGRHERPHRAVKHERRGRRRRRRPRLPRRRRGGGGGVATTMVLTRLHDAFFFDDFSPLKKGRKEKWTKGGCTRGDALVGVTRARRGMR